MKDIILDIHDIKEISVSLRNIKYVVDTRLKDPNIKAQINKDIKDIEDKFMELYNRERR